MAQIRGELDNLKQQLVETQQRPAVVFLIRASVHVSYGSGVVWKETRDEHHCYITAGSLRNVHGWPVVDCRENRKYTYVYHYNPDRPYPQNTPVHH